MLKCISFKLAKLTLKDKFSHFEDSVTITKIISIIMLPVLAVLAGFLTLAAQLWLTV